jgi:hypothetical protein
MTDGEINVDPIEGEFFTTEAIDSLADALVREAIQNSLDARIPGRQVSVRFFFSGPALALKKKDRALFLEGFRAHAEAPGSGLPDLPAENERMDFLLVEDYGTQGLRGDPEQIRDGEPGSACAGRGAGGGCAMIRRLNFTGRKKIPRACLQVKLEEAKGGALTFDMRLELDSLDLPQGAKIYVEAYRGHTYMRFPWGTTSSLTAPSDRALSEFSGGLLPLFRIKVVGTGKVAGRILAAVDRIAPLHPKEEESRRIPLLPVEYRDLGQRVWALDLEDGPVLLLSRDLPQAGDLARSDPSFLALAHPEILRRVLTEILLEQEHDDTDSDDGDWRCQWLRFAISLPGMGRTPPAGRSEAASQDKRDWIETAVGAFCQAHEARSRFEQALKGIS